MTRTMAVWLWAATWVAEVFVRVWHLVPRQRSVFA